jgi:hypothetical protein
MSAHAARWPTPEPPENGPRGELLELYKIAVDEYRFQAQFNWSRTQYWLVFNSGILAAGVALVAAFGDSTFPILVFAVGVVACALSARAIQVSHGYYRAARARLQRFETALDLQPEMRFDTTAGLAHARRPTVNVTAVTYLLLAVLAAADIAGIITTAV